MAGLLALAWVASENRRVIPWRAVLVGLGLLILGAALFLKVPLIKDTFVRLNDALVLLENPAQSGAILVFGFLVGPEPPYPVSDPASIFVLAFRTLPLVLVISALSALLFHWRVLPAIVRAMFVVLEKTMHVGGVVGL